MEQPYTLKWWLQMLDQAYSRNTYHHAKASKAFHDGDMKAHDYHLGIHVRYNVLRQRIAIRIADKYGE